MLDGNRVDFCDASRRMVHTGAGREMLALMLYLLTLPVALGAEEWRDRERAESELRSAGLLATPFLLLYESTEDPEVAFRVRNLTQSFHRSLSDATALRRWLYPGRPEAATALDMIEGYYARHELAGVFLRAKLLSQFEAWQLDTAYACFTCYFGYSYLFDAEATHRVISAARYRAQTGLRAELDERTPYSPDE